MNDFSFNINCSELSLCNTIFFIENGQEMNEICSFV